jgi:MoaA/NifB/PqqE/SkfB family radical SAM enzyme
MADAVTRGSSSGFLGSRVVQIHPTLWCNLSCSHCYSSSGPEMRESIDPEILLRLLRILREEGYEVVSFSGGEPLLYPPVVEVAREASAMGFRVNLITNGLLVEKSRFQALWDLVSRVGISLDGPRELHEAIRGANTFDRAVRALTFLADRRVLVGVAHCVTTDSLPHLPWLAELAKNVGARLLQLHPLVALGRGQTIGVLSPSDQARLFLIAEMLRVQHEPELQIQTDLVPIAHLRGAADSYQLLRSDDSHSSRATLSDLVNPIVVDQRGQLWPLAFGLEASQRIAVSDSSLSRQIDAYLEGGARSLHALLKSAFANIESHESAFTDWYGYLAEHSHRIAVVPDVKLRAGLRPPHGADQLG